MKKTLLVSIKKNYSEKLISNLYLPLRDIQNYDAFQKNLDVVALIGYFGIDEGTGGQCLK